MKRTALAFLLLSVCFLAACSSGADKSIRIGQDLLRAYAMQPGLEYNLYRRVTWDEGDRVVGTLDDEAFPDWARGAFSACVRWEERFHRDIANPEAGPGEPTHVRQTGRAEGWILVGEDMRYHILELTVAFDGQTFDWIRAWDPPE